uniref:Uncharacterized protein n=1 Tax=Chenopodium quinoa TaxID=63459 RepID=A0A803MZA4_CHEQI
MVQLLCISSLVAACHSCQWQTLILWKSGRKKIASFEAVIIKSRMLVEACDTLEGGTNEKIEQLEMDLEQSRKEVQKYHDMYVFEQEDLEEKLGLDVELQDCKFNPDEIAAL